MTFNERIKLARESARLTQEQLAAKSGVKQGTISKIERGDADSSTFTVQLAVACGVRPEWLAMEAGPMVEEYQAAKVGATRLVVREKLSNQELQTETVALLSAMDIDDQNVWLATITAAANKARRAKQGGDQKDQEPNAHDPPPHTRHAV